MDVLTTTKGQTGLPRYFSAVHEVASRMAAGRLDFCLPDGRRFRIEGKLPGPAAEIDVHNPDVFARLIREGDLGFCDAYLDGWWSTPDLQALLSHRPPSADTHFYACGPAVMLDTFEKVCAELGHSQAHIERFAPVAVQAAADARQSYTVELRRSGKSFEVTPDTTLHKMLQACKADVPFSCEEGVCGSCETRVIEGEVDHRDSVLTAAERASNKVMMVCVSGCKSERLVLDL